MTTIAHTGSPAACRARGFVNEQRVHATRPDRPAVTADELRWSLAADVETETAAEETAGVEAVGMEVAAAVEAAGGVGLAVAQFARANVACPNAAGHRFAASARAPSSSSSMSFRSFRVLII